MRATEKHYRELLELAPRYFANAAGAFGEIDRDATAAVLSAWMSSDESRVFVAENGAGKVIGVFMLGAGRVAFRPASVVVHGRTLWVAPEARGAGVARQLMAEAESWAREIGAVAMMVGVPVDYSARRNAGDTSASGERASLFYLRAGFAPADASLLKVL